MARTQRLRLRILHLVNAPGASKSYEDSHRLAAELNAACRANLEALRSTEKEVDCRMKVLDIFTRPFVLALHGPFADQASKNPAYYYSRKMRMEVSALLLTSPALLEPSGLTRVRGPSEPGFSVNPVVSHFPAAATTTATPASTSMLTYSADSAASGPSVGNAYTALRIFGHGHFALVQRQAMTALSLDLISELEENEFPTTDGSFRRKLRNALRSRAKVFEHRVRAAQGTHSTREFLIFTCASEYVDVMLQGRRSSDTDKAILRAAQAALKVCHEAIKGPHRAGQPSSTGEAGEAAQTCMYVNGENGAWFDRPGDFACQGLGAISTLQRPTDADKSIGNEKEDLNLQNWEFAQMFGV